MARPKKTTPPIKNHQISIRFTEELFDVLTKDAEAARLPRAEYIRKLITNHHPVVKHEIVFDNPELLSAFSNLGKIGSNLNQIARHLNEGGSMNLSLRKEILQCITELRSIREDVKEMAGEYRGSN